MPRSVFLGRPWPQPGEPLFKPEDRNWALALHRLEKEEAADRCSLCGFPRSICRDPEHQFAFVAEVEQCHAAYATAMAQDQRKGDDGERRYLAWSARLKQTNVT